MDSQHQQNLIHGKLYSDLWPISSWIRCLLSFIWLQSYKCKNHQFFHKVEVHDKDVGHTSWVIKVVIMTSTTNLSFFTLSTYDRQVILYKNWSAKNNMLTHKSSSIRNSWRRITFNFDCESMSESLNYISGFSQLTFTLSDKQTFAKVRDN